MKQQIRAFLSPVIILSCAVLVWFHFSQNPETLEPLWDITAQQMAILLGLHLILLAINTIRFRLILQKCAEQPIPILPWLALFVHGRFLNTFVPQLGNVYRSIALKQQFSISYTRYITTLIAVGWISTTINICLAWLLIVCLDPALQLGAIKASWLIASIAGGIAFGPFLVRKAVLVLIPNTQNKWMVKINEMLEVTTTIVADKVWFSKVISLSLLVFVFACVNIKLCFSMVLSDPLLGETALFYTLLQLSNIVKLTPGNLGPQEIAFGLLGAQSTVGMSQGILASAIFRAGAIIVICISAFLVLPLRKGEDQ